ncbi:hypothetical protein [Agrobacterium sp. NPDC090273]|uniref:hypothetical protein n=1 Tax=Agrobacterium sp. NPDC090273 TaxID=3363919 RepID=UPI00383A82A9
MAGVTEVNVLADWTLSIDHFYSIIKASLGELSAGGKYQIQATAIPLDVSTEYEWFARGLINQAFNAALEPVPASSNLSVGLQLRTQLSEEYKTFLSRALTLVEEKELDDDVVARIDELEVEIENLSEKEEKLGTKLAEKWSAYSKLKGIDSGDVVANTHWLQGQPDSYKLLNLQEEMRMKIALQLGLRDQQYDNPDHKALLEAYKKVISPAATMRYPRFEDKTYGDEAKKFNVVYFASKEAFDSNLFINEFMMTPLMSIESISKGQFGKLSTKVEKTSESSESITEDWNTSGGVSYGPVSIRANASSHKKIEEDFKSAQTVTISAEALIAIPYNADTWFTPSVFDNPLIKSNFQLFNRWLGEKGTLRIFPTHLVVCRGLSIVFTSSQDWQYDYESDFKAGGSGSASLFGVSFGGGGSYQKHVERQNVEKRGHTLTFSDGTDNLRIIGYHTAINPVLEEFAFLQNEHFNNVLKMSQEHELRLAKSEGEKRTKNQKGRND